MLKPSSRHGWPHLGRWVSLGLVQSAAIAALAGCTPLIISGETPSADTGATMSTTTAGSGGSHCSPPPEEAGAGGAVSTTTAGVGGGSVTAAGVGGGTATATGVGGGGGGGTATSTGAGGGAVTGICLVRGGSTNLPAWNAPAVGPGYAKQEMPGIDDYDGLRAACTPEIYQHLFAEYCAEGGDEAQPEVATYQPDGSWEETGCGTIGCDFVSCP